MTRLPADPPALTLTPPPPDDLRVVRELPIKAARDLAFSNGGAYLAAANGNNVHVWCAYTAAPLAVLRGHNAKVGREGRGDGRECALERCTLGGAPVRLPAAAADAAAAPPHLPPGPARCAACGGLPTTPAW